MPADALIDACSGESRQPTSISRLKLADFRNYASLSLDLAPGLVVFSGDNGAGKTNLLEAISLLSPGRGLRRATYEEIARNGAVTGFAVHALLEGAFGTCEIGTGTAGRGTPPAGSPKRNRDGGSASTRALLLPRICSTGCACSG